MAVVIFPCDRCGKEVRGLQNDGYTAGFYMVGIGSGFWKFGLPGEARVCDDCIQSMPEYKAVYG